MNYGHLPPPGAPPIQVRVRGTGTLTADDKAAANGYLLTFLGAVRLSLGEHHRKSLRLPGGGEVRMESVFGAVTVDIYPVGGGEEAESFFGGIVVRLTVYQDEAAYLDDAWLGAARPSYEVPGYPSFGAESTNYTRWAQLAERRVPSYVKFSGASDTLNGRPAVPGTSDGAQTEWLVFQIARDIPLDVDPFETGAVKIFRIHEPLIGALVEVNDTPGKYLLSANTGSDRPSLPNPMFEYTLSEFYICGKLVSSIPPLEVPDPPSATSPGLSLRTYAFNAASFLGAASTRGIVIAAVHRTLYAIDTRKTAATWQLLDSYPSAVANSARINIYGDVFTETNVDGVVTIVCAGSNGWGVKSGYTVVITPDEQGGPPTITGSLSLMGRAYTAAVPAASSGTINYFYSCDGSYTVRSWVDQVPVYDDQIQDYVLEPRDRHWAVLDDQTCTVAGGGTYTYEAPEAPYDVFLGGPIPASAPLSGSFTISRTSTWGKSGPLEETIGSFGSTTYSLIRSYEMDLSLSASSSGGRFPSLETYSIDFLVHFVGAEPGDPGEWDEAGDTIPLSIAFGEQLEGREDYSFIDLHTGKLAFRYSQGRTGTIYSGSDGGRQPYFIEDTPLIVSAPRTEYGPWRISMHLLRPDGEQVAGWDDFTSAFSTMLSAFGPVTPGGGNAGTVFDRHIDYITSIQGTMAMSPDWFLSAWPAATPPDVSAYSIAPILGDDANVQAFAGGPIDLSLVPADWGTITGWDTSEGSGTEKGPGIHPGDPWQGIGPVADRILRDLRTGGFIAQTYWVGANYAKPDYTTQAWLFYSTSVTKNPIVSETMIGNDVSVVPLKDILNQWKELGETSHPTIATIPTEFNKTFVDGAPNLRVMLI